MTSAGGLLRPPEAGGARDLSELSGRLALLLLGAAILVLPFLLSLAGGGPAPLGPEAGAGREPRIDVNSAPWHVWALLEGIGEARARRIVAHRDAQGPFRAIEDLEAIPGLPRGWLEKARPYLVLGGERSP